ncbi:helix-turn-helix transcriptional regulator [Bradyrhizobium sp. RDM4]|uniref:helix-turn-helix transcriptional regulator n=1 Tax=Bradyrhizobium sp. RDM4 TaxID=3378765 RepID=UPI0038FCA88B
MCDRLRPFFDGVPGFGFAVTPSERVVYAVQYLKGGHLVTDVIGTVNKMSLGNARAIATKIISDPSITRVGIPELEKWRPPPEPKAAEPATPPKFRIAKRRLTPRSASSESLHANDKLPTQSAKELVATNSSQKPLRKLVTFDELGERFSIRYSRTHLARLEKQGKFPIRVAIGEKRIGWVESELEAHIDAMLTKRFSKPGS